MSGRAKGRRENIRAENNLHTGRVGSASTARPGIEAGAATVWSSWRGTYEEHKDGTDAVVEARRGRAGPREKGQGVDRYGVVRPCVKWRQGIRRAWFEGNCVRAQRATRRLARELRVPCSAACLVCWRGGAG